MHRQVVAEQRLDDVTPFDQDDARYVGEFLEREVGDLGGPVEPVQVGVVQRLGAVALARGRS
jgi:hypothetical protein